MVINGYTLLSELKSDNSGFAKWGFAKKDGIELFIKQFLSPVYPIDDSVLSEEQIKRKREICEQFEKRKNELYDILNQCNTGNIITILDFFRFDSKYYVVTEKVEQTSLTIEQISQLPREKKQLIIKTILYSINTLHEKGIVHADIKPNNILIKKTSRDFYAAKLIDFDSSFVENGSSVQMNTECDLVYLSPEAYMAIANEETESVNLTHKIDIFSLGILFHQYLTGDIPEFDRINYDYMFEAILDGGYIRIDDTLPANMKDIIRKMLSKNPEDRPEAWQIFKAISGEKHISEKASPVHSSKLKITMRKEEKSEHRSSFLKQAGDL